MRAIYHHRLAGDRPGEATKLESGGYDFKGDNGFEASNVTLVDHPQDECITEVVVAEHVRNAELEDLLAALVESENKRAEAEAAAKTAIEANGTLKDDNEALQARLAATPADVAAAVVRTEDIRTKLASISDKIKKEDILKLVEEALAL